VEDGSLGKTDRSSARISAALGIVLAAICVAAWAAYNSIQAEENLHSTIFVVRLVEKFVFEQKRWPRSWDELEALPFSSDAPRPGSGELSVVRIGGQHGYEWPAASKDLQRRVAIDFAVDPVAVARQNPMTFTAIKPIGSYYEYRDYGFVQSLQETIKEVTPKTAAPDAE